MCARCVRCCSSLENFKHQARIPIHAVLLVFVPHIGVLRPMSCELGHYFRGFSYCYVWVSTGIGNGAVYTLLSISTCPRLLPAHHRNRSQLSLIRADVFRNRVYTLPAGDPMMSAQIESRATRMFW